MGDARVGRADPYQVHPAATDATSERVFRPRGRLCRTRRSERGLSHPRDPRNHGRDGDRQREHAGPYDYPPAGGDTGTVIDHLSPSVCISAAHRLSGCSLRASDRHGTAEGVRNRKGPSLDKTRVSGVQLSNPVFGPRGHGGRPDYGYTLAGEDEVSGRTGQDGGSRVRR